jgi:hypothetical protein
MTTVIGRMKDLKVFDDLPGFDTWEKSGPKGLMENKLFKV